MSSAATMQVWKTFHKGLFMPVINEPYEFNRFTHWMVVILGIFLNTNPIFSSQVPLIDSSYADPNVKRDWKIVCAFLRSSCFTMDAIIKVMFPGVRIAFGHIPLIDGRFQPKNMDFPLYTFFLKLRNFHPMFAFAQDFSLYHATATLEHSRYGKHSVFEHSRCTLPSFDAKTLRFDGKYYIFDETEKIPYSLTNQELFLGPILSDEGSRTVTIPLRDGRMLHFTVEKHDMLESLFRNWTVYSEIFHKRCETKFHVLPSATTLVEVKRVK